MCPSTFTFTKFDTTLLTYLRNHQLPHPQYLSNHPVTSKQAAACLSEPSGFTQAPRGLITHKTIVWATPAAQTWKPVQYTLDYPRAGYPVCGLFVHDR